MFGLMVKAWRICGKAWTSIWTVGKEDPRRIIHAFKVGLSLTLVSLLYLMEPLFKGIGSNAMWAVMTVVVVLEFTAGEFLNIQIHFDHNHFMCTVIRYILYV